MIEATDRMMLRPDRKRLRRLDACLSALEEAHERGETVVGPDVHAAVHSMVPAITVGMPIRNALHRVFTLQEGHLTGNYEGPNPVAHAKMESRRAPGAGVLSQDAARALTDRIRAAAQHTCLLLAAAHEGRAWSALGYRSWEHYIKAEFGLSRRRSYELLDQARVLRSIQEATGIPHVPNISAYAAQEIKCDLDVVVADIRERLEDRSEGAAGQVIEQVIAAARIRIRGRRSQSAASTGSERATWSTPLRTILRSLRQLPAPASVLLQISEGDEDLISELQEVLNWLNEFNQMWTGALRSNKRSTMCGIPHNRD